jgi:predicted LPLAT superfamily acyltransferase
MHVFSLREPGRRYCFFGSAPQHPQMPVHHERDAYLKQCAGNFAYELEAMMHRDPFQWYNFFPFWEEDKAAAAQKTLPGKSPLAAQPAPTKS